eukprot:TRINITY_DN515_c0_g1_i9.p1 TRINITY_DN515_c0_g1~~TRINITY_DN515_c0_g1_i9.p1  ORF type:complete len:201 (+),score=33.13 TRINITY_DN515_c0_g1_i9:286-888(+)
MFLQAGCDFLVGSPTVFADPEVTPLLRSISDRVGCGVYLPFGALWGTTDIEKMAKRGTLKGLEITMKKHPLSLHVSGHLLEKLELLKDVEGEHVLYEGPIRELCHLAPNNVNTMACGAMAGFNLGFDGTIGKLVIDNRLRAHIIEILVIGPATGDCGRFEVRTTRVNPALPGATSGQATFMSFLNSLLSAGGKGVGFHFC